MANAMRNYPYHEYNNRNTSGILDGMGRVGGGFAIFFGIGIVLAAILMAVSWFWVQARDSPHQPQEKHQNYINVGLRTILPTIVLILITWFITLVAGQFYDSGYESIIGCALALLILQFALLRGDVATTFRKLPVILAISLVMAAGIALFATGRVARGVGYDDMVFADVTSIQAIDDDSTLMTVSYETDRGRQCTVHLEMDCNKYYANIQQSGEENGENQDDWLWYNSQEGEDTIYSQIQDAEGRSFICPDKFEGESGDEEGDNRRHLEDAEEGEGGEDEEENGDEEEEENGEEEEVEAKAIIFINSHSCKAAWDTNGASAEFQCDTPERPFWILASSAAVIGLVVAAWSLCERPTADDQTKKVELLSEHEKQVVAPEVRIS